MVLAEAKSRSERTDRSTALRQLVYAGAEAYVVELLDQGRISSGKAAELTAARRRWRPSPPGTPGSPIPRRMPQ
jgi:hypothetical protein